MSLESSSVVLRDEKHAGVSMSTKDVDTGAQLVAGLTSALDPDEALRIRRKIDKHIMPLMCIHVHRIQFMDKTTLGSSAILGIQLGTVFYLSYLVFEYPQNLALQRFPVGKWMSINIFVWAVALACHAACKNFSGLLVVRLLLGACEGSITAGFLIVSSMFYTRTEQTLRVGYWFLMNGTAQIISGFISFGTLHINTKGFEPWQWLMIITGMITLILAISFWFLFPDSPTNAWFLTPDERAKAVLRIKARLMIEALTDPKTWLFALFSALDNVPNSLTNQQSLILASFGFSNLQTTLLTCVPGVIEILTIFTGVRLAARRPNSRAYVGAMYFVPAWLGILLVNLLPWSDQVLCLYAHRSVAGVSTPGFVLSLSWLNNVTAGHTKRIVTNAIMLSAYCIGNAAGPFMWKTQYKPRNHVPWAVIGACYVVCPILLLVIRAVLVRENRIRDSEPVDDSEEEYVIERMTEDGKRVEVKVEKEFLDLTDRQNRDFRYVL
ncbi:MFS general substrate transporter [Suillus ampliporus]|nr:MFS general substrate transporter [Suillus ampliporus]